MEKGILIDFWDLSESIGKGILIDLVVYLLPNHSDRYLLLKNRYLDRFGDLSGSMKKGILIDLGLYLDPWRKIS